MKVRIISGLCLILVSLFLIFPQATRAQEEKFELTTPYTKLEGTSSFEFEVTLNYKGAVARVFNLSATGPKDWTTYITPTYPKDKMIQDIRIDPTDYNNKISVYTAPPLWFMPEPGEYKITVEASSGELKGTLNLTAIVTAKYDMSLTTPDGRLNTTATTGKDNYLTLTIANTGSAPIDNINFSSGKPSGWTIEFKPNKIDSLAAGGSQTIDVSIKPPAKTIAGDYEITLTASGKQTAKDVRIRVTVETPTVWGWVGVGIIVLVVAGLAFVFMRFSRR